MQVKKALEESTGKTFTSYKAIKYITAPYYGEGQKPAGFVGVEYFVVDVRNEMLFSVVPIIHLLLCHYH